MFCGVRYKGRQPFTSFIQQIVTEHRLCADTLHTLLSTPVCRYILALGSCSDPACRRPCPQKLSHRLCLQSDRLGSKALKLHAFGQVT